tara:strand:+ start:19 stop:330 length:312 start_codon:yes stop_codon:yes gene_type:complete
MPGIEIKGRSKRANYRHGGSTQLQEHSKKHSKKHMAAMKADMSKGKSFKEAHSSAMSRVGARDGLWANIHAKRKRIASGSGEKMRSPGSAGAPTAKALKNSQT